MGAIAFNGDIYPNGSSTAKDSVFDNTGTDLESTNAEDAIKEVDGKVEELSSKIDVEPGLIVAQTLDNNGGCTIGYHHFTDDTRTDYNAAITLFTNGGDDINVSWFDANAHDVNTFRLSNMYKQITLTNNDWLMASFIEGVGLAIQLTTFCTNLTIDLSQTGRVYYGGVWHDFNIGRAYISSVQDAQITLQLLGLQPTDNFQFEHGLSYLVAVQCTIS